MSLARRTHGIIVHTDRRCKIEGGSRVGIPILVWGDGIDEIPSEWFGDLIVEEDLASSTVHEYAKILRPFLRYCRREKIDWRSVDDAVLIRWRDKLSAMKTVSGERINASLQTIFQFYCWAQEKRYLKHHVGIYTEEELGARVDEINFRISARSYIRFEGKLRVVAWRPTVQSRQGGKYGADRHTPTEDEKRRLWDVVMKSEHGVRDSLILSWAERTGARRFEILQLKKSHLPKREQFSVLLKEGSPWLVPIVRKGGRTANLKVPLRLVRRVLSYIEHERSVVVKRCRERSVGYSEPDDVFLSSRTGLPLHKDSVTTIGIRNFRKAGIKRASLQRLRASFAKRNVETFVDAAFPNGVIRPDTNWFETILTIAAESMGHKHIKSLQPYLTGIFHERLQTSEVMSAAELKNTIRELEYYLEALLQVVAPLEELGGEIKDERKRKRAETTKKLRVEARKLLER